MGPHLSDAGFCTEDVLVESYEPGASVAHYLRTPHPRNGEVSSALGGCPKTPVNVACHADQAAACVATLAQFMQWRMVRSLVDAQKYLQRFQCKGVTLVVDAYLQMLPACLHASKTAAKVFPPLFLRFLHR